MDNERREPKFGMHEKGIWVECTCGNHFQIPEKKTPFNRPLWQLALVWLGAAILGSGWGNLWRWIPVWIYALVTVGMAAFIIWFWWRAHRELQRDLKALQQRQNELHQRANARFN